MRRLSTTISKVADNQNGSMGYLNLFIYSFTSLFILMNPIELVPLFYMWTVNNTEKKIIHILKRIAMVVILNFLVLPFR